MIGHAHRKRFQARSNQFADPCILPERQNERQRAWPKRLCKRPRGIVKHAQRLGCVDIGDMHDQGVERRTALCRVDAGNGKVIAGICTKPVDSFGRESDKTCGIPNSNRLCDPGGIGRKTFGLEEFHDAAFLLLRSDGLAQDRFDPTHMRDPHSCQVAQSF